MAIFSGRVRVDETGRDVASFGTPAFPVASYHDDLSQYDIAWHWHQEMEAVVLTHGSLVFAAGNRKYTLQEGEGFFINSGALHGAWSVDTTGCQFHSLVFHPRLVGGDENSVFFQNYVRPLMENAQLEGVVLSPRISWQADAIAAIENAWQACAREPLGYEFQVRTNLSQLLCLLQSANPGGAPNKMQLRAAERIKNMLRYIHENFNQDLNTTSIAKSTGVSESECLRCFRNIIGTTPIQYLRQYRVQRSAQLLTNTQEPVADIAQRCGFQDVSYFTKTFRELRGCTPSEYRKNHAE